MPLSGRSPRRARTAQKGGNRSFADTRRGDRVVKEPAIPIELAEPQSLDPFQTLAGFPHHLVVKIKRKTPGRTAEICARPSILWVPSV